MISSSRLVKRNTSMSLLNVFCRDIVELLKVFNIVELSLAFSTVVTKVHNHYG